MLCRLRHLPQLACVRGTMDCSPKGAALQPPLQTRFDRTTLATFNAVSLARPAAL